MEKPNTQEVTDYKQRMREYAQRRRPDYNYDDEMDENGQVVKPGYSVEQAIMEILDEEDARNAEITSFMNEDPRGMEFLDAWMRTKDPVKAAVRVLGDNVGKLATPEGMAEYDEDRNQWLKNRAETDRMNAESDANWQQSLDRLVKWAQAKGLNEAQAAEVIVRLMIITAAGQQNKFEEEDFELVYKGNGYDADIESARREGENAGRNAQIATRRVKRAESAGNMPPVLSGQGMRVPERAPEQKPEHPFAGIE